MVSPLRAWRLTNGPAPAVDLSGQPAKSAAVTSPAENMPIATARIAACPPAIYNNRVAWCGPVRHPLQFGRSQNNRCGRLSHCCPSRCLGQVTDGDWTAGRLPCDGLGVADLRQAWDQAARGRAGKGFHESATPGSVDRRRLGEHSARRAAPPAPGQPGRTVSGHDGCGQRVWRGEGRQGLRRLAPIRPFCWRSTTGSGTGRTAPPSSWAPEMPTTRCWWIGRASTDGASCCALSASRCRGTC